MNVLAIYVANELLQSGREKAAERNYHHLSSLPAGPSLRDRIASAAAALRRLLGSPVESADILPKLERYPYRS